MPIRSHHMSRFYYDLNHYLQHKSCFVSFLKYMKLVTVKVRLRGANELGRALARERLFTNYLINRKRAKPEIEKNDSRAELEV